MRCNDCGKTAYENTVCQRADVCDDCFEMRGKLMQCVNAGMIPLVVFQQTQKRIANSHGSGRGLRAMQEALNLSPTKPVLSPSPLPGPTQT